jgi:hypothetical protein
MKRNIIRSVGLLMLVALLLMVSVLPAFGAATVCTVNAAGTWNLTGNLSAKTTDGITETSIKTATLTITGSTITSKGVIGTAALTISGYAAVTVTGYIGMGSSPTIVLYGTSTDSKLIAKGKVHSASGTATTMQLSFSGVGNHSEGTLGSDAAAPAAATWSTAQQYNGSTSVLLTQAAGAGSTYVNVTPPNGIKLKDLDTLASGWGMAFLQSANAYGPQIELKFQKVGSPDPNGVGHVDITLIPNQGVGSAAWAVESFTSATNCMYYGNDPYNGTAFSSATGALTLAGVEAAINLEANMGNDGTAYKCGDWVLTRVRVELWEAGARTSYIDQLSVKGKVYSFEPVIFTGSFSGTK